ncbi:Nrap protein [Armillaria novae-zelandiae]|uniref:U3 small nucleolar RNA-associated protein 22 n=1 Tax=Armillaria novae-zelandiae TaxID=153914 RepID=A0AA39PE28_9AGAR|nr:Nrap protein [Armillaria novae-zelandiae]
MAANLKRKRGQEDDPRKTRKLSPPGGSDEESNLGLDGTNDDKEDVNPEDENDEEWGGVESTGATEGGHTSKGKPKKPPTGVEVREMKEAADLFKSTSFKLQIDELLPNVQPKEKHKPPLEQFLLSLHAFLLNIPSSSPIHPLEATRPLLKKGISVPYSVPLPNEDSNWKVAFEPPSNITLVGSWGNKTSVKGMDGSKFGVDVAVEMPDSLFQEKDYLNGRFFHKRSFYLAKLAEALCDKKRGLNVDCSYYSLSDNPRLTRLVLGPRPGVTKNDFSKLKAHICIIPVLSSSSPISLQRLSPAHSNVRSSEETRIPTPLYNTALLTALTPSSHLVSTHALQQEAPALSDALTLLRVWANQRGYCDGTAPCIRGFEGKGPWWVSVLRALILGEEGGKSKRKPLGRGLSSYQLLKAAIDFLATHDFQAQPVFVKTEGGNKYPLEEYSSYHEAVFVDTSSRVNLLADVPLGSLDLLRYDAKKTLQALSSSASSFDPFTEAFLRDQRHMSTRFDAIIRVDLSASKPRKNSLDATIDHGSPHNALLASMSTLLRQGLGNRTKALAILHPSSTSRPLSQAHPSNDNIVFLGFVYDQEHAFRQVDHGPAADDPDPTHAASFRELWGDKAELRMFKDGRIVESIVWDAKNADDKVHLPVQVTRYILERHFGIEDTQSWHSSFDSLLRLPQPISKTYLESGVAVGFKGALLAFDSLVKGIKALDDDLPLSILNISPVSSYLRYTSTFSPVPLPPKMLPTTPPNASYLHAIPIFVQFEKSAKWPDDLKAIQIVKLAFFERVAAALMKSISGLSASVMVGGRRGEDDDPTMEILTADGWAFSLRIWHDRELTLLERMINTTSGHIAPQPGQKKKKGSEYYKAVEAKELYLRRFIHAPRHHRAISRLHHVFPAYTATVRLVKRWFAAHWLLDGHVSEEAVELICSFFFVKAGWEHEHEQTGLSGGGNVPGSRERGFAMVMEFLQGWKWEEGLTVPLYEEGKEEQVMDSGISGEGVWAIRTETDKTGRAWTWKGPDAIVARRVQALAKATWLHLKSVERGTDSIQPMFNHPTGDYDFVVRLDPTVLPRYHQNIRPDLSLLSRKQGKYSNLQPEDAEKATVVRPGYDPARALIRDLKKIYADTFKIFYDPYGGDSFGGVWDATLVKEPRPFRVMGGFSSTPHTIKDEKSKKSKTKDLVVLNQAAVLCEIERLGGGIVKSVATRSEE